MPKASRCAAIACGIAGALLATAPAAVAQIVPPPNQLPEADFDVSPPNPVVGQTVTFESDSSDEDGRVVAQAWDLDNDGAFDDGTGGTARRAFVVAGSYVIGLQVTDDRGGVDRETERVIVNVRPQASLTFVPAVPVAGDLVTFTSTSRDTDGTIARTDWDLDGDGAYDDAIGTTAQRAFAEAGPAVVGVRVTDDRGAQDAASATVGVRANDAPQAGFSYAPLAPPAGTVVTFTSASRDPDGTITGQDWDLDADGAFDDARGPIIHHVFASAGANVVSLRVTDDRGSTDIAFQSVTVGPAPALPAAPAAALGAPASPAFTTGASGREARPALQPLSPFPIVRMRGRAVSGGAVVDLFEVFQVAGGVRVELRCSGRGCPFRAVAARPRAPGRRVRFRQAERRLRAGIVLKVLVTHPSRVGKYVSFRIRSSAVPLRRDRCLLPDGDVPQRCTA